jgi:hypothetical protein
VIVDIGASGSRVTLRGLARADVWFEGSGLTPSGDAALAFSLLVAMSRHEPLRLVQPISPSLADRILTLQDIFSCWFDRLDRVDVDFHVGRADSEPSERVMQFFTGGVDSFYTLKRHQSTVDALVYVHGYDVKLSDHTLRAQVSKELARAAHMTGRPLLEVSTNLKEALGRHGSWKIYHGAALAGLAHLLSGGFGAALIPATYAYDELYPLGSHPLTDPMWSGDSLEVLHSGAEASRIQKLELIGDDEVVRETLRVCWENRGGSYNCGACEKCIRTMILLKALGIFDDIRTFDADLTPKLIRQLTLKGPGAVRFARISVTALRQRGVVPELVRALEWQLRLSPWRLRRRSMNQKLARAVSLLMPRRVFEAGRSRVEDR